MSQCPLLLFLQDLLETSQPEKVCDVTSLLLSLFSFFYKNDSFFFMEYLYQCLALPASLISFFIKFSIEFDDHNHALALTNFNPSWL